LGISVSKKHKKQREIFIKNIKKEDELLEKIKDEKEYKEIEIIKRQRRKLWHETARMIYYEAIKIEKREKIDYEEGNPNMNFDKFRWQNSTEKQRNDFILTDYFEDKIDYRIKTFDKIKNLYQISNKKLDIKLISIQL